MDRSLGFGSTAWYYIFALFTLGFPSASYLTQYLTSHHTRNSPDRSTKSTTSHLNVLCLLVNIGFQVLFHSPPGVLFNFPSRYCFTIGHQLVFSLGRWSCPAVLWILLVLQAISYTRLSLPLVCFSKTILLWLLVTCCSPQPQWYFYLWFGLLRFRSPLLSESMSFSFPGVT